MKKKILSMAVAAAVVLGVGVKANAEEMLQIKGSDTLINLVQVLSEKFMEKNNGKYIAVTGGGSGTGIAALLNGKTDVANASRLMKAKEVAKANAKGIDLKRVVIAMDGLSVITNKDNPVKKLTLPQIGRIFRGEVTNWKEVGGPDMAITLYGRQSNSGTFVFFRDKALGSDYSPKMKRMNGNAQIVEAVKQDKTAIGYVGVGYVKDAGNTLTVLSVALREGGEFANPLVIEDVKSGNYPLTRPLNQYLKGVPQGLTREFIEFELSEAGQQSVADAGFFPIPDAYREFNKEQAGV